VIENKKSNLSVQQTARAVRLLTLHKLAQGMVSDTGIHRGLTPLVHAHAGRTQSKCSRSLIAPADLQRYAFENN